MLESIGTSILSYKTAIFTYQLSDGLWRVCLQVVLGEGVGRHSLCFMCLHQLFALEQSGADTTCRPCTPLALVDIIRYHICTKIFTSKHNHRQDGRGRVNRKVTDNKYFNSSSIKGVANVAEDP